jgi:hypothetical protein
MADSDEQLFSATDHSPDLQENSAAVMRDCQTETKLVPNLYFTSLYVIVRVQGKCIIIHGQKINGVTVFHFMKCQHSTFDMYTS